MRWTALHPWEVTLAQAERIQSWLASRVRSAERKELRESSSLIAGAAASAGAAAVVVLRMGTWEVVETSRVEAAGGEMQPVAYQSGLMAFSYGPLLLRAFERIGMAVDVVMFHAHGIAHPRRCGLAAHLGVLLDTPSLGCAARLLCGTCEPPGPERGDWTVVRDDADIIGACLRTRSSSAPLVVSPGYALTVQDAVRIVLCCTQRHRWPQPLREAKRLARRESW